MGALILGSADVAMAVIGGWLFLSAGKAARACSHLGDAAAGRGQQTGLPESDGAEVGPQKCHGDRRGEEHPCGHGEAADGPSLNADGCPGRCQRPEGADQVAAVFADLGPQL